MNNGPSAGALSSRVITENSHYKSWEPLMPIAR